MALRISVIIPVYNHAKFLEQALQRLLTQDLLPDEILVIDDGSEDESAQVARDWARHFEDRCDYRPLANPRNMGVNATLNRGLENIKGDFAVCTAADDILCPSFIRDMKDAAERFPDARLVTSQYVEFFSATGRRVVHGQESEYGPWYAPSQEATYFDPAQVDRLLAFGHIGWPVNASMLHAETLRSIGGFIPQLKWHADWFASCVIALRHGFVYVPRPIAEFRLDEASYSGASVRNADLQKTVCDDILRQLDRDEFRDVRAELLRRPAPFAPFIRHMIPAITRAGAWDMLWSMTRWYTREAVKGRRPGPWRNVAVRLGLYRPAREDFHVRGPGIKSR